MNKIVIATVFLHHPSLDEHSTNMTFVFDGQPRAQDVLQAYASDAFFQKHEHFNDYGPVLAQCLETYGVPQLNKLCMENDKGNTISVTMVTARWSANILGEKAHHNHEFGHIRIYAKDVIGVPQVRRKPLKTKTNPKE